MTREELNDKLNGNHGAVGIRVSPDNREQVISKLEAIGFEHRMDDGFKVIIVYNDGMFESYAGVLEDYLFDDEIAVESLLI